jgi:hypothetical protein
MVRRTGVTRSRGTRPHQRGERTEVAVSSFPSIGKVGLFQRGQVSFFDEDSATVLPTSAWRAKE